MMDEFVIVYDSREWPPIAPQLSFPLFPPAGGDGFDGIAREGDRVVVAEDGVSLSGRVRHVATSRPSVGEYDFEPSPQLSIAKEGDPLWEGCWHRPASSAR